MSLFYPAELMEKAKRNAERNPWAREILDGIVDAAQPWMRFSDDELWDSMFGCTITRSWHVWSNGHCPACKEGVPMNEWQMDAFKRPWKLRCPQCEEFFPKNDFHTFYRSGLDQHGVFQHNLADRSLLFNAEHPDPNDPLHGLGVDDGHGYREGEDTWRFIGAYLVYGQWKQIVHAGIKNLAAAYAVSGEKSYAHKAGVLLDRVADLYTTFDFKEQAMMYEGPAHAGCVSTWHDACEEVREIALAYDQVREALIEDTELARLSSGKAEEYKIESPKTSPEDVARNIEEGILRDTIVNHERIRSNYPRKEIALLTIHTVLGWPENRDEVYGLIDEMLEEATAVDGVTGEKGLAKYGCFPIVGLAQFLERFSRVQSGFLSEMLNRHPRLRQTYRFHIDTWCVQMYYPNVGDMYNFAGKNDRIAGPLSSDDPGLDPSMFSFLWHLYEETGDATYVQELFHNNGGSVEGLPYDLFEDDPETFQRCVQEVIEEVGTEVNVGSVNKQEWRLAVLRSGEGSNARAAWLDYDTGGPHGHHDGMNLGLFAKGLDLMPDLGQPPVYYGGWHGSKFHWYRSTASHNTVVVDGRDQNDPVGGETTLWVDREPLRAIRAEGREMYGISRYERTIAMVDVSETDFYILDIFRVIGGRDHAKFMHSHFGRITTEGLSLEPTEAYGYDTQMRNFRADAEAMPGWKVDWKIEDRHGYLDGASDVRMMYTDLTFGAFAHTSESWVDQGYGEDEEAWIPRIMVRRSGDEGLESTFLGVIHPYEGMPAVSKIRRLDLETESGDPCGDSDVAVEIELEDGRRDLIIARDTEKAGALVQKEWDVRVDDEICLVRRDSEGHLERIDAS